MTVMPNGGRTMPTVSRGGKYGDSRGGGRTHAGTDFIGYEQGKAILGGTVTHAGPFNSAAGVAVVIDSRDPLTGKTVTICRFHAEGDVKVRKGQAVSEGQHILDVGATGNATGECDHVEIRYWSGGRFVTVNPETWLNERVGLGNNAPPFPLPGDHYFGDRYPLSNKKSVSGFYGNSDGLRMWQQRMRDRGWPITVDGRYGDNTKSVAKAFQAEKGLTVDGKIGPQTWAAAWTAPVT